MWRDITSNKFLFIYDVTKSLKMRLKRRNFSNVHFIKKCLVIRIFSRKFSIKWAIWKLSSINLKISEKLKFNILNFIGREFSKKPLAFCEFSLDFKSENSFELTKDRRIEIRCPSCEEHTFVFPTVSLIPLLIYLDLLLFFGKISSPRDWNQFQSNSNAVEVFSSVIMKAVFASSLHWFECRVLLTYNIGNWFYLFLWRNIQY